MSKMNNRSKELYSQLTVALYSLCKNTISEQKCRMKFIKQIYITNSDKEE